MTTKTTTITIAADHLREFTEAAFRAYGMSDKGATDAADVLIWASLRGVDTHGIRNLKRYYIDSRGVGRRDGVIIPSAKSTVDHATPTTTALNANGGLGLAVSVDAMERAIEMARDQGVGIVTVRNSTHFGAAGYYAHMATEQDMLGFASTGYFFPNGQEKAVVPFGGLLPLFSTNPLAMACPANEYPPFVLDMSTSIVPVNRIEMLEEIGKAFPDNWALDADHQPTVDPSAVHKVVPLGGATSYGGHKGYGLAVAASILTGLLSGAWRDDAAPDRILGSNNKPKNGFAQEGIAHAFAAVQLSAFGDPLRIKAGLDSMIRIINDSPPAEGFQQVLVAGQQEHQLEQQRLADGIPLSESTVADLKSVAELYDVPLRLNGCGLRVEG